MSSMPEQKLNEFDPDSSRDRIQRSFEAEISRAQEFIRETQSALDQYMGVCGRPQVAVMPDLRENFSGMTPLKATLRILRERKENGLDPTIDRGELEARLLAGNCDVAPIKVDARKSAIQTGITRSITSKKLSESGPPGKTRIGFGSKEILQK